MSYDALYGRQSVEKKDSISVESQIEYCRYETHGRPYLEYTDRGFSGKDTNRPGFEKMMQDIGQGDFSKISGGIYFYYGKIRHFHSDWKGDAEYLYRICTIRA